MANLQVSVVIPLYDKEKYIKRALDSVSTQTFKDFEVIVVNDGSTDTGPEIAAAYKDTRIRLIHQKNQGASAARNCGIMKAKSDWIAFVDADDEWSPCYLMEITNTIKKHPNMKVFAGNYIRCHQGKKNVTFFPSQEDLILVFDLNKYTSALTTKGSIITASSVVVSKQALMSVGTYPTNQKYGEDIDTFFRLVEKYGLVFCTKPMVKYWFGLPESACNQELIDSKHILHNSALIKELRQSLDQNELSNMKRKAYIEYICKRDLLRLGAFVLTGNSHKAREVIFRCWRHGIWANKTFKWLMVSILPDSCKECIRQRLLLNG